MNFYGTYHANKEKNCFLIFTVEADFFISVFTAANFNDLSGGIDVTLFSLLIFFIWFVLHTALRFQLRMMGVAAVAVSALFDAIIEVRFPSAPETRRPQNRPFRETLNNIDKYLFPTGYQFSTGDNDQFFDDIPLNPENSSIDAFKLFSNYHSAKQSKSWNSVNTGFLMSLSSILLILVIQIKIIFA